MSTLTITVTGRDPEVTEHPTMAAVKKHLELVAKRRGWLYSNPANGKIDSRNWEGRFVLAEQRNLCSTRTATYTITK